MKKVFLLLTLSIGLSINLHCIEWNWTDIGKDAQAGHVTIELFNSTQSISVIRYKASRYITDIINDPAEMADSTSALAIRHNGIGAVNGSYFDVKKLTPATYVKDEDLIEGYTLPTEEFRTDGVVAIKGHRKVVIADYFTFEDSENRFREVLASGPVLLMDGKPNRKEWPDASFFRDRHPRTILGTSSDGWVYFVVIDGRSIGNADGATIPEAVQIALLLNLENAINLDGGGSSTLWSIDSGVLSHPCDNHRFDHFGQRKIPNAIIFR